MQELESAMKDAYSTVDFKKIGIEPDEWVRRDFARVAAAEILKARSGALFEERDALPEFVRAYEASTPGASLYDGVHGPLLA